MVVVVVVVVVGVVVGVAVAGTWVVVEIVVEGAEVVDVVLAVADVAGATAVVVCSTFASRAAT